MRRLKSVLKESLRSYLSAKVSAVAMVAILLTLAGASVEAKNMDSRLGIGFRNSMALDLPSIATHYYPNSGTGITGALGIDTQENNSKFGIQLGLRKRIFEEENLNFYMGGNFSLLTQELGATKQSGYELGALVASEFFLAGLENLGLNFEAGIAVSNLDKVRFRTLGHSFLNAGMIFYF